MLLLEAVIKQYDPSHSEILSATPYCKFCAVGHLPYKMKRQTIHHFPEMGKIVVCVAAELKPSA